MHKKLHQQLVHQQQVHQQQVHQQQFHQQQVHQQSNINYTYCMYVSIKVLVSFP